MPPARGLTRIRALHGVAPVRLGIVQTSGTTGADSSRASPGGLALALDSESDERREPARTHAVRAASGCRAVGAVGPRHDGRHGLLARLALARAAPRRRLDRQAGIRLRAAAKCRRLLAQHPRRRPGGPRPPFRLRPPAARALDGRRNGRRPPRAAARRRARRLEARTIAEHDAGDHTFFIAAVESVERGPAASALMYRDRSYHSL